MACSHAWQVNAGCGQEASVPGHTDLSPGLLEHPHNMAPDFPHSESQVAAAESFITQPWKSCAVISTVSCWFCRPDPFVVGGNYMEACIPGN